MINVIHNTLCIHAPSSAHSSRSTAAAKAAPERDAGTRAHPGLSPWSGVPHPDRPDPRAPAGGAD